MTMYTKNLNLKIAATLISAFIVTPAIAGHDYAKVVDVQPITELVQVPDRQQVCQQEYVRRRVPEHRSPAPAIFGSILGGIIGHQFGGGHGKTAATVAGAAIGGAVATNAQNRRYPPKYYTVSEQVCHTETTWQSEERIVAWDVSFEYRGKVYHTRMDEPPGDRIPVRVSVEPIYP